MKKGILIIITVILLITIVFFVINYNRCEVFTDGLISRIYSIVANYNEQMECFMVSGEDYGYIKCSCKSSSQCPGYSSNAYHKCFARGPAIDGGFYLIIEYEYVYYFYYLDGVLYEEVGLESISENMFQRWEQHSETNAPEMPKLKSLEEYTSEAEDIVDVASSFFQWFGNAFLYIFKLIGYLWDTLVYYLEYVKIFFEVLIL